MIDSTRIYTLLVFEHELISCSISEICTANTVSANGVYFYFLYCTTIWNESQSIFQNWFMGTLHKHLKCILCNLKSFLLRFFSTKKLPHSIDILLQMRRNEVKSRRFYTCLYYILNQLICQHFFPFYGHVVEQNLTDVLSGNACVENQKYNPQQQKKPKRLKQGRQFAVSVFLLSFSKG